MSLLTKHVANDEDMGLGERQKSKRCKGPVPSIPWSIYTPRKCHSVSLDPDPTALRKYIVNAEWYYPPANFITQGNGALVRRQPMS